MRLKFNDNMPTSPVAESKITQLYFGVTPSSTFDDFQSSVDLFESRFDTFGKSKLETRVLMAQTHQ